MRTLWVKPRERAPFRGGGPRARAPPPATAPGGPPPPWRSPSPGASLAAAAAAAMDRAASSPTPGGWGALEELSPGAMGSDGSSVGAASVASAEEQQQ